MGVEARSAAEMIEYLRVAESVGVDAAQVYSLDPGHGHRPTPDEVFEYLVEVLSATTVPCVLSTHQSVGYRISVEAIARVVDRFDHVVGINSSHADVGYLAAIVDAVGHRIDVHVGGPLQALTAFGLGANGFLSSEANLAPQLCRVRDRRVRTRGRRRVVRSRSGKSPVCRWRCTARVGSGRPRPC